MRIITTEQAAALQMSLDIHGGGHRFRGGVGNSSGARCTRFVVEGRAKEATPEKAVTCQAVASARRAVTVARQVAAVAVSAEKIAAAMGDAEVADSGSAWQHPG